MRVIVPGNRVVVTNKVVPYTTTNPAWEYYAQPWKTCCMSDLISELCGGRWTPREIRSVTPEYDTSFSVWLRVGGWPARPRTRRKR